MNDVDLLDFLRYKTYKGFHEHGYPLTAAYTDRIEYELDIVRQTGFATYFLIVADLCRFMRERKIKFIARGSGCGSLVVWGLGISHRWLDPVKYDIPFERFLNPQRISNPDIDIDIQDDRREEVFQYTVDKYGSDNVAKIITFGTLGAKSSIMDIGRALEIPDYQKVCAEISGAIPMGKGEDGKNWRLEDVIKGSEFLREKEKQYPDLFRYAKRVEGKVRNAGVHAAGTIIAPSNITDFVPVYYKGSPDKRSPAEWFAATQWDMYDAEDRGLLKMDYLGLKTLRVIDQAEKMINAVRSMQGQEPNFDIDYIPQDDIKAWTIMAQGKLAGVFQVERQFVRNFAKRMNLLNLKDPWQLAVLVAIIRPGMMDSGMTEVYLRRASGQEPPTPPHPLLANTFPRTYGIMCFQEDVMATCQDFAGMSRAEADVVRKGVGKKAKEFIAKQQPMFFEGGMQPRVSATFASPVLFDGKRISTITTKPRNPELLRALLADGWEGIEFIEDPKDAKKNQWKLKGEWTSLKPGPNSTCRDLPVVMVGATREECEYIWTLIEAHSRYSFNNAHAAAYGLVISYQTAYLKANYPLYYQAAIVNSEAGVGDKEQGYNYKVSEYVEESRYLGLGVLPPCVKRSADLCKINPFDNTIRFGLGLIKMVSSTGVQWIMSQCRNAPTLKDFILCGYSHEQKDGEWRSYSQVGKRDLEALAISGALDCFGIERSKIMAMLPKMIDLASKYHEQACKEKNGRNTRLKASDVRNSLMAYDTDEYEDSTMEKQLELEQEYTGCFLSQSPFMPYRDVIEQFSTCTPADLEQGNEVHGPMQFEALLYQTKTTVCKNGRSKGREMARLTFRGVNGTVECTAFSDMWAGLTQQKDFMERGKVYLVHVKPDRNGRGFILENVRRLSNCGYSNAA